METLLQETSVNGLMDQAIMINMFTTEPSVDELQMSSEEWIDEDYNQLS